MESKSRLRLKQDRRYLLLRFIKIHQASHNDLSLNFISILALQPFDFKTLLFCEDGPIVAMNILAVGVS